MSSEAITRNDLTAILDEVLPSPVLPQLVVEKHTTATLTGNGAVDGATLSISKSGWFPIGIVGYDINGSLISFLNLYELRLDNIMSGSADITYSRRVIGYSGSSTLSATIDFYVLWVKE